MASVVTCDQAFAVRFGFWVRKLLELTSGEVFSALVSYDSIMAGSVKIISALEAFFALTNDSLLPYMWSNIPQRTIFVAAKSISGV